jgi:hypothetical protein
VRGERLARQDRRLRLMSSVVAVLQPQPMPMDRGVHVPLVLDVDDDLRALPDLQDRSGDRPVVGQHPDRRVTQSLGDRSDPQIEMLTVRQLDQLGRARLGQPRRVSREAIRRLGIGVVLHRSASFLCTGPRRSPTTGRRRSATHSGRPVPRLGASCPGWRRARRLGPEALTAGRSRAAVRLLSTRSDPRQYLLRSQGTVADRATEFRRSPSWSRFPQAEGARRCDLAGSGSSAELRAASLSLHAIAAARRLATVAICPVR